MAGPSGSGLTNLKRLSNPGIAPNMGRSWRFLTPNEAEEYDR